MSYVTENQPDGTPTWIDLGVPDLERAMGFYGSLFGWEFEVGPAPTGHYTTCLLHGRRVAAIAQDPDPDATGHWWNMYLATGDCDGTARRITDAGGTLVQAPTDVMDQGRMALAVDPVGARFGLWQGRAHIGAQVVNEPGSLVRNDLVTPTPDPERSRQCASSSSARRGPGREPRRCGSPTTSRVPTSPPATSSAPTSPRAASWAASPRSTWTAATWCPTRS